jgi:prophage antirepressor-like protein
MRKIKIGRDWVLELLEKAYPRSRTCLQMVADSGRTRGTINSATFDLARKGLIERVSPGTFKWNPNYRCEEVKTQEPLVEADQRSESTAEGRAVAAFHFEGYDVRIVNRDGTPWDRNGEMKPHWVLVDVCRAVGIENPRNVAARLDDDEKYAVQIADAIGRPQPTTIVTRPGLTKVLRESRKPEARAAADRFDRWVRHEVLEQVYETGSYVHPGAVPHPIALLRQFLNAWMLRAEKTQNAPSGTTAR